MLAPRGARRVGRATGWHDLALGNARPATEIVRRATEIVCRATESVRRSGSRQMSPPVAEPPAERFTQSRQAAHWRVLNAPVFAPSSSSERVSHIQTRT